MNYRVLTIVLFVAACVQLTGCGATRSLKPLGKGNHKVDLSLGGPMLDATAKAPAPYAIIGYSYGLNSKLNLEAHYHAIASVYQTFALELGASYEVLAQGQFSPYVPEIMINGRMAIATDGSEAVVFPMISPTVSYELSDWTPYTGVDLLWQFHRNDQAFLPQSLAPYLGVRYAWSRIDLGGEFKWLAANHDFEYNNLDFPKGPGKSGALGAYIYLAYRFGESHAK